MISSAFFKNNGSPTPNKFLSENFLLPSHPSVLNENASCWCNGGKEKHFFFRKQGKLRKIKVWLNYFSLLLSPLK